MTELWKSFLEHAKEHIAAERWKDAEDLLLVARLEAERLDELEGEAEILHTLGNVYVAQGDRVQGEQFLREGLQLRESLFGGSDVNICASLIRLGILCCEDLRFQESEQFFRRAQVILEGDGHDGVLLAVRGLAEVYKGSGQHEKAEREYRNYIETRTHKFGDDDLMIVEGMLGLADTLMSEEKYKQADVLFGQIVTRCTWLFGSESVETAKVQVRQALNRSLGNFYNAEPQLAQAVKRLEKILDEDGG